MTATPALDARIVRPAPDEYAQYYHRYVSLVPDGDIVETLASQVKETAAFLRALPEERGWHRYAEGKWSIREVIGHLADGERIFTYRALRFARADATPLPGFDENDYVPNSGADGRPLASLVAEYQAVRAATVALLDGLPSEAWQRSGSANGVSMSVRSLAWITAGHERHHREILRTRYLGA
jgi:uncharacterized damage-inducible protein DinB